MQYLSLGPARLFNNDLIVEIAHQNIEIDHSSAGGENFQTAICSTPRVRASDRSTVAAF